MVDKSNYTPEELKHLEEFKKPYILHDGYKEYEQELDEYFDLCRRMANIAVD